MECDYGRPPEVPDRKRQEPGDGHAQEISGYAVTLQTVMRDTELEQFRENGVVEDNETRSRRGSSAGNGRNMAKAVAVQRLVRFWLPSGLQVSGQVAIVVLVWADHD